jgi:protein-L-isoaspartate(D-aspartate) O-methyltransferase
MSNFASARRCMVDRQIVARGVRDPRVLEAMRQTPREAFLPPELADMAYDDAALPIDAGQTISQPYIVALMLEAAALKPTDRALEIGAGSGYAAAAMSRLCAQVVTIERHADLAHTASARLKAAGYDTIEVHVGDGTKGWSERAPFDAILVAAASPSAPEALLRQLEIGGRLIIPIGQDADKQRLMKIVRAAPNRFENEDLGGVSFVPLIGEYGWPNTVVG